MKLLATLVFESGQCHLLESRGTQDNNTNLGINEFIETQHDGPLMVVIAQNPYTYIQLPKVER